MENSDLIDAGIHEQRPVRREKESVDDFEHLGLDNSPTQGDVDLATSAGTAARDLLTGIDKISESVVNKIDEVYKQPIETVESFKMDVNEFEKGDTLLDKAADADDKLDKYISQLASFAPSVPSHEVSPIIEDRKPKYAGINNFLNMEREGMFVNETVENAGLPKNLDFSEPPVDDVLTRDDVEQPLELARVEHVEKKDSPLLDHLILESVSHTASASKIEPVFAEKPAEKSHKLSEKIAEPPKVEPVQAFKPEPSVTHAPSAPEQPPEPTHHHSGSQPINEPLKSKPKQADIRQQEPVLIDAEVIFKKMGLDAWFHPELLNPRVESLIYWRDPTKSGPVFGGVLVVLLALTYLSLISVIAYLSLLALTATISFRIYKNVLQAVQKTGDGHPFKEYLDKDITLPQEKVKELVETTIAHLNAAGVELRRLFLVDDLVDSIKFGVLLWCLTYLGAWFNGMTLVIIAWVALFTLPKVYETNKTQIDANLDLVRSKIADITSKVKAAIPIGKKEEKKEQ